MPVFSGGMWDLVPRPVIQSGPPTLRAQSFSHWTAREVSPFIFLKNLQLSFNLRTGPKLWSGKVNKASGKLYPFGLKSQKMESRETKAAGKWRENPEKKRIREEKPQTLFLDSA